MNLGWEPGNDKQNNFVALPSPVPILKSYEKKYQNNFLKVITASEMSPKWEFWREGYLLSGQQENMMDFDYCGEYIKQIIIMAVLKKGNSHSVVICTLIKSQ